MKKAFPFAGRRLWSLGLQQWGGVACLLLTVVAVVAIRSQFGPAGSGAIDSRSITLATVLKGTFERDITGESVVGAPLNGIMTAAWNGVISFKVRGGDPIRAGQLLATIDSPELESRLLQERAQLEALVADTKRAQVEQEKQREINLENFRLTSVARDAASRELRRKRRAFELGAYPEVDVLQAEDTLRIMELEVEHVQSLLRLDSTRLQLEARSRALARERQALVLGDLQHHREQLAIRSAVTGQVAQLLVGDHSAVSRDAPVISLTDLSNLELGLKLPQIAADEIRLGAKATVVNALESFEAQVVAISPEIIGGEVTISLQFTSTSPPGLRQGQRLTTRFVLDRHPNALIVQRGPFIEELGGQYAYVVHGHRAIRRPIQIGAISMGEVEIARGLHAGDAVIVSGLGNLSLPEISILH